MSLSKQLLILISALFLMVFSVNFILSINNMRTYLEGEAQIHAQDTATSLGVSLSHYMVDETDPVIETTMNAIFDMGYYQQIKLVNVEQKMLVNLTNDYVLEGVPEWFVTLVPMETAQAESEISSGWSISGVVSVSLNPGYAYFKLYELAMRSFYYSLAAFVFSITLLLLVLRITLSPLRKIDQMAVAIAKGEFVAISVLPWTTEVKNVTISMNKMSRKIEGVITKLNTKLEQIGKKLHQDELTGLYKKSRFMTDMKQLFIVDTDVTAFIFLIKIDGLARLVKELSSDAVDQFIKEFAQHLSVIAEQNTQGEVTAYRFVGAEFVLLMRSSTASQAKEMGNELSLAFSEVGRKYNYSDIAHIGIAPFNSLKTMDEMLFAANEAYEQALFVGKNSCYLRVSESQAKDIEAWKALVFSVVDDQIYKLSFIGKMVDFQSEGILIEEAFTQVKDSNGELVAIGTFFSIAEKFSKIVEMDKGVTEKVIDYIYTHNISHAVAINISTRTIKDSDFRIWLQGVLKKNKAISGQLVFSLSAYAVIKEVLACKDFINYIHQLGARVMIKRFESHSMPLEVVKELKPDFIRLARDIGNGISHEISKKAFVEAMQGVAELLDIEILAEEIRSDEDYNCIKDIGISGASR